MRLKPVSNVSRIVMIRSDGGLIVVEKPEVKWDPRTGTRVFFGAAKVENSNLGARAARNLENAQDPPARANIQEEDSDDEVDSFLDCDEKDIRLVMEQANVTRKQAVKALLKNSNQFFEALRCGDAIIELLSNQCIEAAQKYTL